MNIVYVLNQEGKPLMPSRRGGRVRWLLKTDQARVVCRRPFTIQLLYKTTAYVQKVVPGVDPGRTETACCFKHSQSGNAFYCKRTGTGKLSCASDRWLHYRSVQRSTWN